MVHYHYGIVYNMFPSLIANSDKKGRSFRTNGALVPF